MIKKKILIIAEAGVNHNGNLNIAKKLVKEASKAGADVIKFQTFTSNTLTTKKAKLAKYQKLFSNKNLSQFDLIKKLELDEAMHKKLKSFSDKLGIEFLSTAFDIDSLNFLISLGIKRIKIPSGEITNFELLNYISKQNLPVIMSTGMSTMKEIIQAHNILISRKLNKKDITILHCNSAYPTPMKDVNLKAMLHIKDKTKSEIGYSDHTLGIEVPIAATALGAKIIEKHFTLNKNYKGPDHKSSIEPNELRLMVQSIRNIEKALGNGLKKPQFSELINIKNVRKSLVAQKKIKVGEKFTRDNITSKRPGYGISPMFINKVLGKKAKKIFLVDDLITL